VGSDDSTGQNNTDEMQHTYFWNIREQAKVGACLLFKSLNGVHGLIAAVATTLLAYIAWNTDTTLHDTLVAANRAWITPVVAQVDSTPSVGKPFGYTVKYGNVGKEPAIGFAAQEELDVVDAPAPHASWYTVFKKSILKDVCKRTTASNEGGIVYPSGLRDYTYAFSTSDFNITPEIENGSKIIFAHGCFAYKTFGRERKSEYCFLFLIKDPDGRPLASAHCPYGNSAN
jgi:hypothetical protein